MPVQVSYPGVYIEELPSGVRTIVGVPTSITAFVGRTRYGPVNEPILINNFGDFERAFGGLVADLPMTYAVKDFYLNGGSQALIVRLYAAPAENDSGRATFAVGSLNLQAASPGAWADKLKIDVTRTGIDAEVAARYGLTAADLFHLTVTEPSPSGEGFLRREHFLNLSVVDGPRRVDQVLAQESQLVQVQGDVPEAPPADTAEGGVGVGDGGADSAGLDANAYTGNQNQKTGLFALEKADIFNLLCIPPDVPNGNTSPEVYGAALAYCRDRRAMLIVDPPAAWGAEPNFTSVARTRLGELNLTGSMARYGAIYFPRVRQADPLREGRMDTFVPCGIVAGVMARTDADRGVWKAPAGIDAAMNGVRDLQVNLSDMENGTLNQLGINCLRSFPVVGRVVWGARTLRGADQLADEYKYVPVRRLALFLEESLYRGLKWVVFEPNDEPLWSSIRVNVGAFMHNLFRQGAFQGTTPREAYLVKCDSETTTQNDINLGIVNILVGFAPLKPAEFVVVKIQQLAGQINT